MRAWLIVACAACGRGNFEIDADLDTGATIDSPAGAHNIAFVTSTKFDPSAFGADLAVADAACAARATAGGLAGTYRAYLSTDQVAGRARFDTTARGWVRVDGRPFADRMDDAAVGKIYYPLEIDELGGTANDPAVTGTNPDGTPSATNCTNYSSAAGSYTYGQPQGTTGAWSTVTSASCATPARLYCFGIDHDTPLTIQPATGRIAFVTAQTFVPNSDLAGADGLCNAEAAAQHLPGAYLALLDTTVASGASRFDLAAAPWVRLDGIQLADSPLALMSGNLRTSLNVSSVGAYVDASAYTGGDFTTLAAGVANDCGDWGGTGGGTMAGDVDYANDLFASNAVVSCLPPLPLYCLQQ